MPRFDLPLAELRSYRPAPEPDDFDAFWAAPSTSRGRSRAAAADPIDTPLERGRGIRRDLLRLRRPSRTAWLLAARRRDGPCPPSSQYLGYGGGRGLPHEQLVWAASGYAHLFMDTRGQGARGESGGDTPDPHGAGPPRPAS